MCHPHLERCTHVAALLTHTRSGLPRPSRSPFRAEIPERIRQNRDLAPFTLRHVGRTNSLSDVSDTFRCREERLVHSSVAFPPLNEVLLCDRLWQVAQAARSRDPGPLGAQQVTCRTAFVSPASSFNDTIASAVGTTTSSTRASRPHGSAPGRSGARRALRSRPRDDGSPTGSLPRSTAACGRRRREWTGGSFLALADHTQVDHDVVLVGPAVNTDRAEHEMLEAHRLASLVLPQTGFNPESGAI